MMYTLYTRLAECSVYVYFSACLPITVLGVFREHGTPSVVQRRQKKCKILDTKILTVGYNACHISYVEHIQLMHAGILSI